MKDPKNILDVYSKIKVHEVNGKDMWDNIQQNINSKPTSLKVRLQNAHVLYKVLFVLGISASTYFIFNYFNSSPIEKVKLEQELPKLQEKSQIVEPVNTEQHTVIVKDTSSADTLNTAPIIEFTTIDNVKSPGTTHNATSSKVDVQLPQNNLSIPVDTSSKNIPKLIEDAKPIPAVAPSTELVQPKKQTIEVTDTIIKTVKKTVVKKRSR